MPWVEGGGYFREVPRAEVGRDRSEVRVVPDVKELGSELEMNPLGYGECLIERPVPGPGMIPLPQFPKKPKAGAANEFGSNHCATVFVVSTAATQFGRVARPFVDVDIPGEKTKPLSTIVIPENVQWPNIFPRISVLFRRNGRFQT